MVTRLIAAALFLSSPVWAGEARGAVHAWDVPRAIEAVDVPERVDAFGAPVAIHAVRSKEKVEALRRHFIAEFSKKALYLPPPGHLTPASSHVQVTGLDPDTFIAYSVFLQPNPDGTTTVILTETFLAERRPQPGELPFAPPMPGATGLLQTRTEGLQLASYRVRARPEEVTSFYGEVLGRAGYASPAPGRFVRADEHLEVTVVPAGEGEVSVSLLYRAGEGGGVTGAGDHGEPAEVTP